MNVEEINVNIHIPINEMHMIAMQPFIKFPMNVTEPFKWADDAVVDQLSAISHTLDLAQSGFNNEYAHFTIFPEYSVPGLYGAKLIDNRIRDIGWKNGSVIIAGLDGLMSNEYSELCKELNICFSEGNAPSKVATDKWVNCCIIWIKDEDGILYKWVQPKIKPSWPENCVAYHDMFCGSTVYIFKAKYVNDYPCNFFTLICFDWIAANSSSSVCDEMLEILNAQCANTPTPLQLAIIIQHNPEPNHYLFIDSTYDFLIDTTNYPFIDRRDALVIHVNTAVSIPPASCGKGAFTACIFSPSAYLDCTTCRPTVCMQPAKLRGTDKLKHFKDVVFREMGECIHLFNVKVPHFVKHDASGRSLPLPDAKVFSTHNKNSDKRLNGTAVPAIIKWINDSLDYIKPISKYYLENCNLKSIAELTESSIIKGLRDLDCNKANHCMNLATCAFSLDKQFRNDIPQKNPDSWDQLETDALEHVVHSMAILNIAYECIIKNPTMHGMIHKNETNIQVVAILGDTFENCRKHYDNRVDMFLTDPVLAVFRDHDNLEALPQEYSKITDTKANDLCIIDYNTLISLCRKSTDIATLKEHLDEIITCKKRFI
ncbi:MAG: hypothetical protein PHY13_04045 [Clostridia bacterium]|nr:hypothetical protein [Clostridia bacterium]